MPLFYRLTEQKEIKFRKAGVDLSVQPFNVNKGKQASQMDLSNDGISPSLKKDNDHSNFCFNSFVIDFILFCSVSFKLYSCSLDEVLRLFCVCLSILKCSLCFNSSGRYPQF